MLPEPELEPLLELLDLRAQDAEVLVGCPQQTPLLGLALALAIAFHRLVLCALAIAFHRLVLFALALAFHRLVLFALALAAALASVRGAALDAAATATGLTVVLIHRAAEVGARGCECRSTSRKAS